MIWFSSSYYDAFWCVGDSFERQSIFDQTKTSNQITIEVLRSELKIGFFDRFIDEKSVFERHENDFDKIKSKEKKSTKNREKSPIFHRKITDFSPKNHRFFTEKSKKSDIFPGFKYMKKLILKGFEPTQNA